jgi:lipopolysaccharide transport system permease protein
MTEKEPTRTWKEIITPENNLLRVDTKEIWRYRDLLWILVKRDVTAIYKQTILGPLWFFIQPVLTTIMYVLIFSRIGKFSTAGIPPVLFYLSGLVLWLYCSECILRTSTFFKDNNAIFSKVYFPRLIVPVAIIFTNLIKLSIHLALFFLVYTFYLFSDSSIQPNASAILFPLLIFMIGILGLGMGIIISSLTTKYKDLVHLVGFGVQLMMFASPVLFPLSSFDGSRLKFLIMANPMTGIIETFRYGFLGTGEINYALLAYDISFIFSLLLLGIITFNTVEKDFVDTI